MAVTWVDGTAAVFNTSTSVSGNAPAGIADDDTLLAAVFARSAFTTPAGWTKLVETATHTNGTFTQRLAIFSKDVVTAADAGASFAFTQASSARMGLVFAVARDVGSISFDSNVLNNTVTFSITPNAIAATLDDSLLLCFGSAVIIPSGTITPTAPTSFTIFSGAPMADYRIVAAYRAVDNTESNSGAFLFSANAPVNNGLGAVTMLLAPSGTPPVNGLIAVASPLGAPAALGETVTAARFAAASPLGAPAGHALNNFSALLADAVITYLMDVDTPTGLVRIPISSWQATLQAETDSYVQCVVPAPEAWTDVLAEATAFYITRRAVSPAGVVAEDVIAQAPLETVALAQGAYSSSATLSGYEPAAAGPEAVVRELSKLRTIFNYATGYRVRCEIDWLLRPGHTASFDGAVFAVRYISYYVQGDDAFMDVGE